MDIEDPQLQDIPTSNVPETQDPQDIQQDTKDSIQEEDLTVRIVQSTPYNLRPGKKSWIQRSQEMSLTTFTVKAALSELGIDGMVSMMDELSQLHRKSVFKAIKVQDLTPEDKPKILRTIMFLKKKRDGRIKSRLVADGSTQKYEETIFDVSSPTVATESVFIAAAVAAGEKRFAATTDVEGAYLHCKMIGRVIVRMDKRLTAILVELFPEYLPFVHNGELLLILLKALYGCIESARLFFDHVRGTLLAYGFEENPYDQCVFNKMCYGKQCTVCIHVDDLLITCQDSRGVDDLIKELRRVYTTVNACKGPKVDYLGMDFEFIPKNGIVKISTVKMVNEVVHEWEPESITTCKTPAANNLFDVSPDSELLGKVQRERFHSVVAKLLYLAKRGRPDILLAVNFLSTRVINSTIEDWSKLDRIIKYLRGTVQLTMQLGARVRGDCGMEIDAYADASHAPHHDAKGHSGTVISLGIGAVFNKSSKQKLVSKSSTESELIGLSDSLTQILWSRLFIQAQGYQVPPVTVHQDNKSTIVLAEKGRSNAGRTRHINIRYYFVKDKIESEEIRVRYTPTEEMVADFFTKPLQGSLFIKFRTFIMGHELDSTV